MSFCDGSSYEGQWRKGKKHGQGVFTSPPSPDFRCCSSFSLNEDKKKTKSSSRQGETEQERGDLLLHSPPAQEEEEGARSRRGSFDREEKKADSSSSSSSSSVDRGGRIRKAREETMPGGGEGGGGGGGSLVYEGVWEEDVPLEKGAEWIVTFPSGDKYIGCLSMTRTEEKARYMKTEKKKKERREREGSGTPTEGREGEGREKEEEEENKRSEASEDEDEDEEEEEEDYSMYVVPHGEGLSKQKALGETYEGQWIYGARHGQGVSSTCLAPLQHTETDYREITERLKMID